MQIIYSIAIGVSLISATIFSLPASYSSSLNDPLMSSLGGGYGQLGGMSAGSGMFAGGIPPPMMPPTYGMSPYGMGGLGGMMGPYGMGGIGGMGGGMYGSPYGMSPGLGGGMSPFMGKK
ncbi:unnamed protein product [Caenorhabditis bovis]|uniref:Uncharacterized protein n=1 Tax=Caenorhabditis bovis TaxID=2654633 RepID=A0A8S1EFH0_9PELO|nr:unnamed protein product [Caenorhabditis bovis]